MKSIVLLMLCASCICITSHSQNKLITLQGRISDGNSNIYGHWTLDPASSQISSREFIITELQLSKTAEALNQIDSVLQRGKTSYFDFEVYPLERSAVTYYGRSSATVLNQRTRKKTTEQYNFIVTTFSQIATISLFPLGEKDGSDPFNGAIKISDGRILSLDAGKNQFTFHSDSFPVSSKPVAFNNPKTSWNEEGLKGKVKEVFTKKFSLLEENGEIVGKKPRSTITETYNKNGLLSFWKESERMYFIEKNISGSYENRTIKEFRNNQNITITSTLKTVGDKATMESFVEGKFANKTEYNLENGRVVSKKVINYLNEVELEFTYLYGPEGHPYSVSSSFQKQENSDIEFYKYLQFDTYGNWVERITYLNYGPRYLEVRELQYY